MLTTNEREYMQGQNDCKEGFNADTDGIPAYQEGFSEQYDYLMSCQKKREYRREHKDALQKSI